jgi:hypothetical protein
MATFAKRLQAAVAAGRAGEVLPATGDVDERWLAVQAAKIRGDVALLVALATHDPSRCVRFAATVAVAKVCTDDDGALSSLGDALPDPQLKKFFSVLGSRRRCVGKCEHA